jgi:hypothetical protein
LHKLGWIESVSNTKVALVGIRTVMIALLSLLPTTSVRPEDIQNSFVEFKDEKQTTTFDLRTVEVIQPGKFVIIETVLDNPDVMRFELKVLDILRSHCVRQVGFYPAPAEVFILGPPDMPVKDIEVKINPPTTGTKSLKVASWWLPYFKTMDGAGPGYESYRCNPPYRTETEEYLDHREGEEPKPMMHGHEKSDPAIVAMKPVNKAKEAHCGDICGGGRSGVGGAKGGGQGEYASAKHVLDSEPGSRVTGAGAYTATFAVTHPRWEPYAGKPHVRFWAGGVR